LKWLFGTDDIEDYFDLLVNAKNYCGRLLKELNDHMETLKRGKEDLELLRKVLRVCENHGIDIDKEVKQIELYDNNLKGE
jgi:hypothetical protein